MRCPSRRPCQGYPPRARCVLYIFRLLARTCDVWGGRDAKASRRSDDTQESLSTRRPSAF
eukprot:3147426-Pleurochrysis_carterae.AAC.1